MEREADSTTLYIYIFFYQEKMAFYHSMIQTGLSVGEHTMMSLTKDISKHLKVQLYTGVAWSPVCDFRRMNAGPVIVIPVSWFMCVCLYGSGWFRTLCLFAWLSEWCTALIDNVLSRTELSEGMLLNVCQHGKIQTSRWCSCFILDHLSLSLFSTQA